MHTSNHMIGFRKGVRYVYHNRIISSFMTYLRVCNKSSTTSATSGAGTAYYPVVHPFFVGLVLRSLCSLL